MRRNSFWVAALVVACNCESTQTPPAPASPATRTVNVQARVTEQALEATRLQEAIALGRLVEARERAASLVMKTADPAVRRAAQTVAEARDVPAMAAALGALGHAYAAYHQAQAAPVALPRPAALPSSPDVEARMKRHQWAAARLWEGLIVPDSERWASGARELATLDIEVSRLMHEKPNEEVVGLAERMREQAMHALAAEGDDRARLYGEILQTCASCHSIVRPTPVVSEIPQRSHP